MEKTEHASIDGQVPETEDIASVVDQIRAVGKLPPLSDAERLERRIANQAFLEEQAWRLEQQRAESERKRAELAAIAAEQERERLRQEYRERSDRESRERSRQREISDLRLRTARQEVWQRYAEAAARNAVVQRQQQVVIDALDRIVNPTPVPEPMTEVVYVSEDEAGSPHLGDRDFNPKLWIKKPRPWW